MNTIRLDELDGYTEDPQALRRFERPYLIPSLAGFVVALIGLVLLIAEMQASHYYRGQSAGILDRLWFKFVQVALQNGLNLGERDAAPVVVFVGGLLILAGTVLRQALATPNASLPGTRMEKYLNADAPPGNKEIIYVDRAARTYFRRLFINRSGPRINNWNP